MEIVNSTKSSTYRLLEKLIDSNRLFSDFSAIYSRFDSIRLTDSTSTKPTLEAIGSHKKFLALSLKASNGFEGLLKTSKGL